MEPSKQFKEFLKLVERLRKDCPWDRKQTHDSIKDNLIEEAYEAVEAIDNEDYNELKKELGDLLLHVVFHSRMAAEHDRFTIEDVIYSISEKLIRRHPHVFDHVTVDNDGDVAKNWETIKLEEGKNSTLDGLPKKLPALIKAQRMQEKAGNVGFDWSEWKLAWEKLNEEIDEWKEAVEHQNAAEKKDEFGDLLFSLVNVGRLLGINAEDSLRQANLKFKNRFRYIEEQLKKNQKNISDSDLQEMDHYWEEAKKRGY